MGQSWWLVDIRQNIWARYNRERERRDRERMNRTQQEAASRYTFQLGNQLTSEG